MTKAEQEEFDPEKAILGLIRNHPNGISHLKLLKGCNGIYRQTAIIITRHLLALMEAERLDYNGEVYKAI